MKRCFFLCCAVAALLFASGCGTVSTMRPADPAAGVADKPTIEKYERIVVLTFTASEKLRAERPESVGACRYFADAIANELRKAQAAPKIERDTDPAGALVIKGEITRCTGGSASLRFWVGMGAGSSYFDATVRFADGTSGHEVGTMTVDRNSWGLGGGLAAGQTIESFMNQAARKVAEQIKVSMKQN